MITDEIAWKYCDAEDLWIYDKLILSRKLGYMCGPVGVDVPKSGSYIVRPITNIDGMGIGAEILSLEKNTDHLPPGYFWCEVFTGIYHSVDYIFGDQILCVEGERDLDQPLYKWKSWTKCNHHIPLPEILVEFHYENINCEFVGDKLIEVHLRHNPDFMDGYNHIIPVWLGEDITPPPGYYYKPDQDYKRLGFFVPK